MSHDLRIAETILQQLGGRRFVVMTGSKEFRTGDDYTLIMNLARNSSSANRLSIRLEPTDTYTMRFYRETGGKWSNKKLDFLPRKEKTIKVFEDVYCDQLEINFRDFTGLETRMPRVIGINA